MMDMLILLMTLAFGVAVFAASAWAAHRVRLHSGIGRPLWWNLSALTFAVAATIWYVSLDLPRALGEAFPRGNAHIDIMLHPHAGAAEAQAVLDDLTPLMVASATVSNPGRYRIRGKRVQVVLGGLANYSTSPVIMRLQRMFDAVIGEDLKLPSMLKVELLTEAGETIPAQLGSRHLALGVTQVEVPDESGRRSSRTRQTCVLEGLLEMSAEAATQAGLSSRPYYLLPNADPGTHARHLLIPDLPPTLGREPGYELVHWRAHSLARALPLIQGGFRVPVQLKLVESRYPVSLHPCDENRFAGIDPLWLHLTAKRDYPALARHAATARVYFRASSRWYSRAGWVQSPTLQLKSKEAEEDS
ncbi:hypothetical protein WCE55_11010 [Luteimonas sp. MJ293]|uniref:hypothetical protein n=1 Tax=Luteimonas sp. MJ146 TaxID=3129240 RepID=UPI0031BB6D6E